MSANVRLVVDGDTLMDGDLGSWALNPPEKIAPHLKPGAGTAPWMKAALFAIAQSSMAGISVTINVTTRDRGWTMSVDEA